MMLFLNKRRYLCLRTYMKYKYLFGPVPSRRLGISLGIDLIPFKTCSYNCVYCECGATTNLTIKREEYIPADKVICELKDLLKKEPKLDYITFSGSGEPTLNSEIGSIIEFLKTDFPEYKIAILTNGSLLSKGEIRKTILKSDLVMPSLDAISEKIFQKINRPDKNLKIKEIVQGLIDFRKEFNGKIWLEIFIIPEINDTQEELRLLRETIGKINPDKIQLNSLDRPGTESWVKPANETRLKRVISHLKGLPTEVIADFNSRKKIVSFDSNIEARILATIQRRPCTTEDLSESLGVHINEINKYLQSLLEEKRIGSKKLKRGIFFRTKE